MKLQEHIDIIKGLPITYKNQLLRLLLEILRDHYNQKIDQITDPPTNATMTTEQFIEKCTYRPPQAVKPISFKATPRSNPKPVNLFKDQRRPYR